MEVETTKDNCQTA